jgi:hypothetical protein
LNISINSTGPFTPAYYTKGAQGYANVTFHISCVIKKGKYQMQVAKEGLLLSWQHTIHTRSFKKEDHKRTAIARAVLMSLPGTTLEKRTGRRRCTQVFPFWGARHR